jgi:hypothetical protein
MFHPPHAKALDVLTQRFRTLPRPLQLQQFLQLPLCPAACSLALGTLAGAIRTAGR